ncbi:MAG: type II toxin-antitoxin system HicB family antitoxin [Bauldia litoralis]
MKGYIALVLPQPGGGYRVDFPDLPGCRASGRSVDEALAKARAALKNHAARLYRRGLALPAPRPANDVFAEEARHGAVAGACIQLRDVSVKAAVDRMAPGAPA